jgi:Protein of unknown function (DUF4231)
MKLDRFNAFLENTYIPKKDFYYQRARYHQRTYQNLQWLTIGLSLANAILVGVQPFFSFIWIKVLAMVCSITVASLAVVLKTFNYQEKWAAYNKTFNDLEKEYDIYLAGGEKYSKEQDKESYFILRVHGILDQANATNPYTTVPPSISKLANLRQSQQDVEP